MMTTLTQLIEHYCPDGVEYVKLEDVFDLGSGYTPSRKNTQYWENGSIPWFRMDDIRTNGRILSHSLEKITPEAVKGGRLFPGNSVMLSTSATIGEHAIVTTDFMCNQRFHVLVLRETFTERVRPRFVYYVGFSLGEYCREHVNEGNFKTVSSAAFKEFPFPLPPREVQDAVVERLDAFDALVESLDSEIVLREKRFEYFREQLLNFDESDGVEYMKLEDVAEYSSLRVDSVDLNADTFVGVDNLLKDRGGKTLSEHGPNTKRSTKYQVGDVLLGNIRPYLRKIWHATNEGGCSGDVLAIHPSTVYSRFLYWTLFGDEFWHYNNNFSRGGKMPRGDKSAILAYQFPLPSLAVQQDIADKLDTMQALIDNLKQERDLRKAQFEYYREKLLTFNA